MTSERRLSLDLATLKTKHSPRGLPSSSSLQPIKKVIQTNTSNPPNNNTYTITMATLSCMFISGFP